MADDPVPPESSSSAARMQRGPPSSSSLRQRMSRASTAPWDPPPAPPQSLRRRSSVLSEFDSMRSSTDHLLNPTWHDAENMAQEEPSHWHSLPLVFAILPAIGGVFFTDGSAVITDILLLGLVSLLLNWCVRMPWEWYHATQTPLTNAPETGGILSDVIPEEDFEDEDAVEDLPTTDAKPDTPPEPVTPERSPEYVAALRELRSDQLLALVACFLGPVFGAYLLHTIRASLSRPSEGLVSNYNLSVFLLAAEIRPTSHLIRMLRARTIYLQRIVRENTPDPDADADLDMLKPDQSAVSDLGRRLGELESHMADMATASTTIKQKEKAGTVAPAEVTNLVRQSFQPQLDALNRAVRRYEKRATTQTMSTEARLQDLEARLKDALALAAAAARSGQKKKPGVAVLLLDWVSTLFMMPLQAVWTLFVYPLQTLSSMAINGKRFLFGYKKEKKDKGKAKATHGSDRGHGSLNGYRAQAGPSSRR